ncbi:MAG: DivIVA domain-containing protein [Actinobacteria bacterium]|nr:MAG: DivIVA domain-containing protein [Actinomycetota bacterium]
MTTIDRANTFTQVKRGYDPAEVDAHLENLRRSFTAELDSERQHIRQLEAEIVSAKQRDEAVHLTLVAASRTRDEMLAAAQSKLDEATAAAEAEAEAILKQVKYEAFRLVTEAREDADHLAADARKRAESVPAANAEAESIVARAEEQARRLLADAEAERAKVLAEAEDSRSTLLSEAEATGTAIVAAARTEAMAILTGAQQDADAIRADDERAEAARRQQLQAEVAALELHVASLKDEVARLEAATAEAPIAAVADGSYTKTRFAQKAVEPVANDEAAILPMAVAAVVEDLAVDVIPEPVAEPPAEPAKRGSFYSRRSAKLRSRRPRTAAGSSRTTCPGCGSRSGSCTRRRPR